MGGKLALSETLILAGIQIPLIFAESIVVTMHIYAHWQEWLTRPGGEQSSEGMEWQPRQVQHDRSRFTCPL